MRNRRRRLFACELAIDTNSTDGTICGSIWKNQQPSTVFLYDAKTLDSGETLHTLQKYHHQLTYLLPESFSVSPFQLKALYVGVSGRTSSLLRYSCMMPKTINIGQWWDTTHATEDPPLIDLPSSRKFWRSPMVSNPVSHVRFSLTIFCSALTQIVLTRTVSSKSTKVTCSWSAQLLNGI